MVAVAAGLTSPMGVLLMPLALVGALWDRGRAACLGLIGSAGVQAVVLLANLDAPDQTPAPPVAQATPAEVGALFVMRALAPALAGRPGAMALWRDLGWAGLYAVAALAGVLLCAGLVAGGRRAWFPAVATSFSLVSWWAVLVVRGAGTADALRWPEGGGDWIVGRYSVVPVVLVLTATVWAFETLRLRTPATARRVLAAVGAAAVLAVFATSYRVTNSRSDGPSWDGEVATQGAACATPGVEVVGVRIGPWDPWTARVPCSALAR